MAADEQKICRWEITGASTYNLVAHMSLAFQFLMGLCSMSKNPRPAVIEMMERRVFLDASVLTETIDSSTLPASISDQTVLKGTLAMTISNNSGADEKDPGAWSAL